MIKKLRIKFVVLSMIVLIFMQVFILAVSTGRSYGNMADRADELLGQIHEGQESASVLNARFFSVVFDRDGEVASIQVTHIAGMNRKSAVMYAKKVQALGKEKGFVNGYRYRVWQEDDGQAAVVFLSRSANLEMLGSNVASTIWVSSFGLGIMFILLIFATKVLVRPMETSYRKQKEFITAASHELKTPLTVIGADLEMLESENGCSQWIQDIRVQTERLTKMTHELLFLSRLEMPCSSRFDIVFPISDLAEEIIHSYQGVADKTRTRFKVSIAPGLEYCGDENEIQHLFIILLDNAFKYCGSDRDRNRDSNRNGNNDGEGNREKNGDREVAITLRRAGGIILEVTNTAKPLTKEELDRLFERFYRVDASRTEKEGFGIGLSIAKAIVENHKGRIRAYMADGNHFCMSVFL